MGPKLAEKHVVEFSEETLNAGKAFYNTAQYGFSKGASQVNIIETNEACVGIVFTSKKSNEKYLFIINLLLLCAYLLSSGWNHFWWTS